MGKQIKCPFVNKHIFYCLKDFKEHIVKCRKAQKKNPVHVCKYYFGHMFEYMSDRNEHEKNCNYSREELIKCERVYNVIKLGKTNKKRIMDAPEINCKGANKLLKSQNDDKSDKVPNTEEKPIVIEQKCPNLEASKKFYQLMKVKPEKIFNSLKVSISSKSNQIIFQALLIDSGKYQLWDENWTQQSLEFIDQEEKKMEGDQTIQIGNIINIEGILEYFPNEHALALAKQFITQLKPCLSQKNQVKYMNEVLDSFGSDKIGHSVYFDEKGRKITQFYFGSKTKKLKHLLTLGRFGIITFYDSDIEQQDFKKVKFEKSKGNILLKKLKNIRAFNQPIIIQEEIGDNIYTYNQKIKNLKVKTQEQIKQNNKMQEEKRVEIERAKSELSKIQSYANKKSNDNKTLKGKIFINDLEQKKFKQSCQEKKRLFLNESETKYFKAFQNQSICLKMSQGQDIEKYKKTPQES